VWVEWQKGLDEGAQQKSLVVNPHVWSSARACLGVRDMGHIGWNTRQAGFQSSPLLLDLDERGRCARYHRYWRAHFLGREATK
jgi:hypothetical protein